MPTPNFLIIGASKCGTTTLYDLLDQHPQVCFSSKKEVKFFNVESNYSKEFEWYSSQFHCGKGKKIGEATPGYINHPQAAQRIKEKLGDKIKLIVILRHPVDRALSHYNHNVRNGAEWLSFQEAIKEESNRIKKSERYERMFSYLTRGYYSSHIERFLSFFSIENIEVLSFEKDLIEAPKEMVHKVECFLNLDHMKIETNIHSNDGSKQNNFLKVKVAVNSLLRVFKGQSPLKVLKARISQEERRKIFEKYFKSEPANLKCTTNVDFSYWEKM